LGTIQKTPLNCNHNSNTNNGSIVLKSTKISTAS